MLSRPLPYPVRGAGAMMAPALVPTPAVRATHNLTHVPYAPWCSDCVRGRGRDAGHPKRKKPSDGP
eukprot:8896878-Heterocapsa_arctica.AAC.1